MRLVYVTRSGTAWDITEVFQSVAWSGDYQQAARKVELTLAWSDTDPDFPREVIGGIDNGEMLFLYSDAGDELFQGYVFSVSKALGSTTRTFTAYDGLIYLVKSSIAANFQKTTAQGVTRQVAAELGVPVGTMADDAGVATNFAHIGKPAYEAIMGAWTQVKKASGKFYMPVMHGGKLNVIAMGETVADRTLSPSADLVAGEVTSAIDEAVTKALVVDKNGKVLASAEDAETRKLYGLLQSAEAKDDKNDAATQAKEKLKGPDQQISLSDIIGGQDALDLVTGNAVLVEEPSTGLHGKFFIINDTHTFADGQHKVALGLDFKGMMDEVEVELVKAAKKKKGPGGNTKPATDPWSKWADYGAGGVVNTGAKSG